jgi:hypothetical protein
VYDTLTSEEFAVQGDGGNQCCADISSDKVVWAQVNGSQSWDIYAYDLSSSQLIPVATRPLIQFFPKVDGDWVIYLEDKGDDPHDEDKPKELYLHNLITGEDFLLGVSPYAFRVEGKSYGIANNRVVWIGWTPKQQPLWPPALRVYNLQSRTDRTIDLPKDCVLNSFRMAGDLIAFSCQAGFYGYDLAQSILFDVPHPRGVGDYFLSETNVVFQMVVDDPDRLDYLTPGAPTPTSIPQTFTPSPARFQLLVAPIMRR